MSVGLTAITAAEFAILAYEPSNFTDRIPAGWTEFIPDESNTPYY